jgi:hypothetical protein
VSARTLAADGAQLVLADAARADALADELGAAVMTPAALLADCGGMVSIAAEYRRAGAGFVEERIDAAGDRLRAVLDEARREGRMPLAVAYEHALRTIAAARDHTREEEC